MDQPLKAKALCHLKYIDAVANAGGAPVLIPPCADEAALDAVLSMLDGFCLIGGPDYLPSHYGETPHPKAELMHERRDRFDLLLADVLLHKTRQPVLGICGGQQLLNIAAGGALIQDLQSEWKSSAAAERTLTHSDAERTGSAQAGNAFRHEIRLKAGSLIERIVGAPRIQANSFHHQAVNPKRIASGFVATAWADDGVIEAIEADASGRFILGVQWHPERQTDEPQHRAIFERFVAAARSTL